MILIEIIFSCLCDYNSLNQLKQNRGPNMIGSIYRLLYNKKRFQGPIGQETQFFDSFQDELYL